MHWNENVISPRSIDAMNYFDIHDVRKVLTETFLIDRSQRELEFTKQAENMKMN